MKTQTLIIILSVILLIVFAFIMYIMYNQKQKSKTVPSSANEQSTRERFFIVLKNMQKSKEELTWETLKANLLKEGIIAIKEGETHTMEYNPNRVTVRENMKQCITSPCYNDFEIISVG